VDSITDEPVNATQRLRVMIVDDSPEFTRWLVRYLELMPEVVITGIASSAEEALVDAACAAPDVVVMDISMPGCQGTEATRRIKRWERPPRVVLVSGDESPERKQAALSAGADAFLAKSELTQGLSKALGLKPI
jgi:DNA-binding NarL/FixJ family response regulator